MKRTSCAICNSDALTLIYKLKDFPLCQSGTNHSPEQDCIDTIEIVSCEKCGCVQHSTLVDPSLLYKDVHSLTYSSSIWSRHHALFSEFILNNTSSTKFMEIGGYSGVLAREILFKKKVLYSILDLCDSNPNIPSVTFYNGNCESFPFNKEDTLILSHTFEHLYKPSLFVDNIFKQSINEIFLSLPNLKEWVREGAVSSLHTEHTFFFNESMITTLFAKVGYRCKLIDHFGSHSIFFYFVKDPLQNTQVNWDNPNKMINFMKLYFDLREQVFQDISITTPFFIFPAGHFGQMTYYFLKKFDKLLLGFLDNDSSKINKRVYGCSFSVYSPTEILHYKDSPLTVVISAGPYSSEIRKQVSSLHPSCLIKIIDLQMKLDL